MMTLYQFKRTWGIPNQSNFCVKVETYLRMVGLPYNVVATLPIKGPNGKLPYLEDDGNKIADSSLILDYLKAKQGDQLDRDLKDVERSTLISMQRLFEDHLYWVVMYTRWQGSPENWRETRACIFNVLPPVVRTLVAAGYRKRIKNQIRGHGIGRHSAKEIYDMGKLDLDAASGFLGSKPFFLGDKATSLDATAFACLITIIACPIESPVKEHALSKTNLVAYCERMRQRYFPEFC